MASPCARSCGRGSTLPRVRSLDQPFFAIRHLRARATSPRPRSRLTRNRPRFHLPVTPGLARRACLALIARARHRPPPSVRGGSHTRTERESHVRVEPRSDPAPMRDVDPRSAGLIDRVSSGRRALTSARSLSRRIARRTRGEDSSERRDAVHRRRRRQPRSDGRVRRSVRHPSMPVHGG